MENHAYFLKLKKDDLIGTLILTSSKKQLKDDIWTYEAGRYFNDDEFCLFHSVIGICNLCKKWKGSNPYFYINSPYVDIRLRRHGYGKLLYKLSLSSVAFLCRKLKSKPRFAQHNAMEGYIPKLTVDAQRVYKSLEKNRFIKLYKSIDNNVLIDGKQKIAKFNTYSILKHDMLDFELIGQGRNFLFGMSDIYKILLK